MYSKHEEALTSFIGIISGCKLEQVVVCVSAPWDIETQFHTEWPNNSLAGVYLFFDKDFQLLYVGKSYHLGSRLQKYFRRHSKLNAVKGVPKKGESINAKFIITIGLRKEFSWIAPSLEEYLILKLKPINNRIGNY